MAGYSRHSSAMAGHPDAAEMRERYARPAEGRPVTMIEGLILATGLYLAVSPWVIHFRTGNMNTINNLIIGLAIAVIGLGLVMIPERALKLAWLIIPAGIWMIISPWVVSAGHGARAGIVANNVAAGTVVTALGLATVAMIGRRISARRTARAMR